jgi:aminoglycoside phosphotransferase (APT) family kinase protein
VSLRELQGPETWVWVVNEEVVFRFPRFATRRARVDVEVRVVTALRASSSRLRELVPAITHVSPHGYSGQRLVRGVDGETRRPPPDAWPWVADDVRSALAAVHATPAPPGVEERPLPPPGSLLEEARAEAATAGVDPAALADPPVLDSRRVLCHGDTKPEHFLLDDRDRLAGIIDWADACVSHPVRDLAGIVLWLGSEFARLVDSRDATAAVCYARCFAVIDAARHARGEWNAPPVHEHLKWVMSSVRPTR